MEYLSAVDRVVLLLCTLGEAQVSYGIGSTGQGARLMPSMYVEGSYQELEQRLGDLRDSDRRPLWWHASSRYRWGLEQTVVLPVVRTKHGPKFTLPPNTELIAGGAAVGTKAAVARIYRWSDRVDERLVTRGVVALVLTMYDGAHENINLPPVVLARLEGKEAQHEKAHAPDDLTLGDQLALGLPLRSKQPKIPA